MTTETPAGIDAAPPPPQGASHAPASRAIRAAAWSARAAWVRARFLVALAAAFLVVGRWDVLRTYWDRWTAPAAREAAMGAVSADTEYFCPMEPGVVSDWPAKCPICHMALVRRKKGDMGPLPDGVIARVQLSPERILLAGVRTAPLRYEPLARTIRLVGPLAAGDASRRLTAETSVEEASWLRPGLEADVLPDPPDGLPARKGKVAAIEGGTRVTIDLPDWTGPIPRLAAATVRIPMADREPFRSMPRGEPPIRPGDPRAVYTCAEHPASTATQAGRCPQDGKALMRSPLAANQKVAWWCPMHPSVCADVPGRKCDECGGMTLVPRVVSYCPAGKVLAVPESAVIDTGARRVVYVEGMPGMFDGVEVRLGPRCGTSYPVVDGLEEGMRVAEAGAFLVDAETRLNPGLAAAYLGARRGDPAAAPAATATAPPGDAEAPADHLDLDELSPADRAVAIAQKTCPVTKKPLGSMGTPVRVEVKGRAVFVCCSGCTGALQANPDRYLPPPPAAHPAHHP
ncbi:copper/silver efflux system membrane fusion protein CusB [Aquisphaera giovannonii]|uniref:Copper/silver efflux system membrane fusion protein CusB n=1 Tax=Aquisphaera giovannonii TaxID=406548 RepID=A0A5B9W6P0_9BACT|nr:heavy metal-binding domain-containing protein [Aquisphaera giovannonii]QEH35640.1 copper/silver efflux system membrane fusion protein CusB [Aquisphaera giovannonii]